MSCNWNTKELLRVLKKRFIKNRNVRVGDILISGNDTPNSIASVQVDDTDGTLTFSDAWGNGVSGIDPNGRHLMVDRRAVDGDAMAELLESERIENLGE